MPNFFILQRVPAQEGDQSPRNSSSANVPMNSKDRLRFALLTVTDQSK